MPFPPRFATPFPPATSRPEPGRPGVLWTIAGYLDATQPDFAGLDRRELVLAIARGTARLTRFGGHTLGDREPMSVAEHSVDVADDMRAQGYPPVAQLVGLMHDAAEGLLGYDISSPLKRLPEFDGAVGAEDAVQDAVWRALGLTDDADDWRNIVSRHDLLAAGREAAALIPDEGPWPRLPWPADSEIDRDRQPLSWREAQAAFVARATGLLAQVAEAG